MNTYLFMQNSFKKNGFSVVLILPKTVGPGGPRVTLVRASQYDPDKFLLDEFLSAMLVIKQVSKILFISETLVSVRACQIAVPSGIRAKE